jgi:16S rRNA (adenine1518-N6/adenine1519-N6)-dimethyltransferase
MQDPLNASSLLKTYGLAPNKDLGQNFVIRRSALEQIISAACLEERELILEIGAGLGALTLELGLRGHRVVAVEYDKRLIPILNSVLAGMSNVSIIHGDILQLDPKDILDQRDYIVVANIPYHITSAVIRRLMGSPIPARKVVLTVQREVAERVAAGPGELSLLALSVQIFGYPQIHSHISSSAFYPQPKVDSSVLSIEMYAQPKVDLSDIDYFFWIAKAGFNQKRKQLRNALAGGLQLTPQEVEKMMLAVDLDPTRRAQELDLDEWQRLCESFKINQKS